MSRMTDYMIARSVLPAATLYQYDQKEGYKLDTLWEEAVFDLYTALSTAAEEYANNHYDDEETGSWRDAMDEEIFQESGWAQRIVNVIEVYRRLNGVHPEVRDIEHKMMEAIRKRVEA